MIINWIKRKVKGKATIEIVGAYHVKVYERNGCLETLVRDDIKKNLLVTVGKDTMLKYLGVVTGGAQLEKIGVGDSATAPTVGDTALLGASQTVKVIASNARSYVRPTLFVSVEYGYTEANYTWNELGLYDANDVLVARQVDGTPLVKTSSKRAIVEWQLTI